MADEGRALMSDYIKRGHAKNAICSSCSKPCSLVEKANSPCVTIIELARIPSDDVSPVRHGRWIDTDRYGFPVMECSECGAQTGTLNFPYCFNCGARMDGESDE